jgi:hypothetical protein
MQNTAWLNYEKWSKDSGKRVLLKSSYMIWMNPKKRLKNKLTNRNKLRYSQKHVTYSIAAGTHLILVLYFSSLHLKPIIRCQSTCIFCMQFTSFFSSFSTVINNYFNSNFFLLMVLEYSLTFWLLEKKSHATVFESEVYAIWACWEYCISEGIVNEKILIFSDS